MPDTLSATAVRLSDFIDTQVERDAELRAWSAGTVDGGPSLDGYYPLTDALGVTMLIPSVARITELVSGPGVQDALDAAAESAVAAQAAAQAAAAGQLAAQAASTLAATALAEATAARSDALNSAAAAAFYAQSIPGLLSALQALSDRVMALETTGPVDFVYSLDFSDSRNSQYI
jgi:hypothetical protein